MSLVPNRALEGAAGNQGYNLQRSLRFRSSASAYLSRTPASSGDRKKWTWSGWVKKSKNGAYQMLFVAGQNSTNYCNLYFDQTADRIEFFNTDGGANSGYFYTNGISYRDPSAWYHVILAVDSNLSTGNRAKLYVNGAQVNWLAAPDMALNYTPWVNSTNPHQISKDLTGASQYLDGYLAEVNFIDGQALTPSSFGETDTATGVWKPKKYTGTYGTNGFYLPFSDNTSATTLAYDKSGNGNNWTPNNISTTAGSTYDSMLDVPTLTSAGAANYCVLNPLVNTAGSVSIAQGNLYASVGAADKVALSTIELPNSGKYYFEWTVSSVGAATVVGVFSNIQQYSAGWSGSERSYQASTGNKRTNQTASAYGASFTTNDVIGTAVDMDAGTITFYKNGVSQGVAFSDLIGTSWSFGAYINNANGHANFGQRPFSYTPPTGFKALNTFNLPDPTIKKPNQYMDATLWTGNGSTQTITNSGSFAPDLVWIKARSIAVDHQLGDTVRGATKTLNSNATAAEQTIATGLTAFNSNGFSLGAQSDFNNNGSTYVGWQWKKGATPGFDIVTYTGNGANRTIAHNLGVAPKMMIVKARTGAAAQHWRVMHTSLNTTGGQFLTLSTTDAVGTEATIFNSTLPTSSVFSVGTANSTNGSGYTYVAYLFAEIAGFSKFGSYTGNGSADGPFVYCGFRPRYLMIKRTDVAASWSIMDTARSTINVIGDRLAANDPAAELTGNSSLYTDILSNGFKARNAYSDYNANGGTYIFAAFAENPFKYANAR